MYLDPGFGGMLLQLLVALIAAGGILLFTLRKKIHGLFSKNKPDSSKKTSSDMLTIDNNITNDEAVEDDMIDLLSDEAKENDDESDMRNN